MNESTLWNYVHICFDDNDGSLPSIDIENLDAAEIAHIFEVLMLEGKAQLEEAEFYSLENNSMKSINSVSNAARLVPEFKASPFHLVFSGFHVNGREIPELGVFFFQDSISIDYRMGKNWNAYNLYAFFVFLNRIVKMTKQGQVIASVSDGPPYPECFNNAWKLFQNTK